MINELIEQIGGRERLVQITSRIEMYGHGAGYTADEVELMARALLAVLDVKPIAAISKEDLLQLRDSYRPVLAFRPDHVRNSPAEYLYTAPPATSVPEGWKLMPLKASPEILQAGIKAHYERQKHQQPEDVEFKGPMECAYDDMLSAAPAPEGDGG